jgi:hypothetical protein
MTDAKWRLCEKPHTLNLCGSHAHTLQIEPGVFEDLWLYLGEHHTWRCYRWRQVGPVGRPIWQDERWFVWLP